MLTLWLANMANHYLVKTLTCPFLWFMTKYLQHYWHTHQLQLYFVFSVNWQMMGSQHAKLKWTQLALNLINISIYALSLRTCENAVNPQFKTSSELLAVNLSDISYSTQKLPFDLFNFSSVSVGDSRQLRECCDTHIYQLRSRVIFWMINCVCML